MPSELFTSDYWLQHLQLQPHPEGGYFRETYRSQGVIPAWDLKNYFGSRPFGTAIYFLLKENDFSAFHKLKSDEVWHFYAGCSLNLFILSENEVFTKTLGIHADKGESLQQVVPANHWFAAQPVDSGSYTLAGCTMAPGFDFQDFELGKREELIQQFPLHTAFIEKFTRQ